MSDTVIEIPVGSIEYLYADIEGDVVLDAQPVAIGLGGAPNTTTWREAGWIGIAGTARTARVLLDGTLGVASYPIWVKVTDNPEVPIIHCGKLKIVNR